MRAALAKTRLVEAELGAVRGDLAQARSEVAALTATVEATVKKVADMHQEKGGLSGGASKLGLLDQKI